MASEWRGDQVVETVSGRTHDVIIQALAAGVSAAKRDCYFGHGLQTGTYQRSIFFDNPSPGLYVYGSFGGAHNNGVRVPYALTVNTRLGQIDLGWRTIKTALA